MTKKFFYQIGKVPDKDPVIALLHKKKASTRSSPFFMEKGGKLLFDKSS